MLCRAPPAPDDGGPRPGGPDGSVSRAALPVTAPMNGRAADGVTGAAACRGPTARFGRSRQGQPGDLLCQGRELGGRGVPVAVLAAQVRSSVKKAWSPRLCRSASVMPPRW